MREAEAGPDLRFGKPLDSLTLEDLCLQSLRHSVGMDADELSGLLGDAERQYSTLSCEFAVRFHPDIAGQVERQQVEAGEATLVGASPGEAFRDWDDLAGKVIESRALVWVNRPHLYREQDFDEDDPQLLVRDGTTWWRRDGEDRVSSASSTDGEQPDADMGRYEMCVRPELLTARLGFQVLGAGERAGREVIRAQARRLPVPTPVSTSRIVGVNLDRWWGDLPVFANGGDDFTVELDAVTGVVLRIASVFESQDWMVIEAVKAEFDEPLPKSTFRIPQDQPAKGAVKKRRGLFRNQ